MSRIPLSAQLPASQLPGILVVAAADRGRRGVGCSRDNRTPPLALKGTQQAGTSRGDAATDARRCCALVYAINSRCCEIQRRDAEAAVPRQEWGRHRLCPEWRTREARAGPHRSAATARPCPNTFPPALVLPARRSGGLLVAVLDSLARLLSLGPTLPTS